MTDLRLCKAGIGFALVATLTTGTVVLAGGGSESPLDPPGVMPNVVLGVTETGTTVGAANDADEVCPFTGSTSGDLFYDFTPAADMSIKVDLCASGYDTKTYVYDEALTVLACNDDACGSDGFRSTVNASLTGGQRYIIAVDGYAGDNGPYTLTVTEFIAPSCDCPAGAIDEGEPCVDGSVDTVNGGCNSSPPVFSPIAPGDTYCSLAYFDGALRDTDWYEYTATDTATYTWEGVANFPEFVLGRVENFGNDDCGPVAAFAEVVVTGGACELASVTSPELGPGVYWWFGAMGFTNVSLCANGPHQYYASLSSDVVCTLTGDLDGDDDVDFDDFTLLLANFGQTCP